MGSVIFIVFRLGMQAPLPSKTVAVGTSRDSRENFMFGALFHQHQSLAYYVGLVKPLQKNLGYSQRYISQVLLKMLMLLQMKLISCALTYIYPKKDNVIGLSLLVEFLVRTPECTETLILHFSAPESMKK